MLIAVVEDDEKDSEKICRFLARYAEESGTAIETRTFGNGMDFVSDYAPDCDIVFLDIEMPFLNGMDAAKKIRERDAEVAIVFVTNMSQYAIMGYEVDAVDYVLKPIEYPNFRDKLRRAVAFASRRGRRALLVEGTDGEAVRIFASDLLFAEKEKNYVNYFCRGV